MTDAAREPFRLLLAHFLSRFFRSERTGYEAAARERLSGVLAALTVAAPALFFMVFTLYIFAGGDPRGLWPFGAYFFGLVMIVLGLLAVLAWDELLPDEADLSILVALPVPRPTLVGAKVCAVALLLGACALAVCSLTPLVFASFLQLPGEGTLRFVRIAAAYFSAALAAGVLAFTACGALRGVVQLLPQGPGAGRASAGLQSSVAFGLVGSLALLPLVADRLPERVGADPVSLLAMPPAWFVGLAARLAGDGDPAFLFLGEVALLSTAVSSALFLWTLELGFRRPLRGPGIRRENGGGWTVLRWAHLAVDGLLLRHPRERATFWFLLRTLWRNPGPRLRILFYLASAAGCIFLFRAAGGSDMALAAPVAAFFSVAGARSALRVPVQERAAWVLRSAEAEDDSAARSGLRWAVAAGIVAPVFAALGIILLAFGSIPHLAAHLSFHFLLACLLAEILVVPTARFPFAAAAPPSNRSAPGG